MRLQQMGACIPDPIRRAFSMRTSLAVTLIVAGASVLGAQAVPQSAPQAAPQAAPVPCRAIPCPLIVDWGVGKTMADMPPDRKYGAPAEFDDAIRAALRVHEITAVLASAESKVAIRLVATYKTRVLCDDMPGTMPDRTCATIGEAIANFSTTDPAIKVPTAVRMINRCGATGAVMSMKQFGKFAGDMIWFALEGEQQKANKPAGKC